MFLFQTFFFIFFLFIFYFFKFLDLLVYRAKVFQCFFGDEEIKLAVDYWGLLWFCLQFFVQELLLFLNYLLVVYNFLLNVVLIIFEKYNFCAGLTHILIFFLFIFRNCLWFIFNFFLLLLLDDIRFGYFLDWSLFCFWFRYALLTEWYVDEAKWWLFLVFFFWLFSHDIQFWLLFHF